jgi:hypothetical protein
MQIHPTLREVARLPHRRPTGEPPPLPYQLQTSGVGWLVAAMVLVGLALAAFAAGLRGPAVAVTVADDAVVRWLARLPVPGLEMLVRPGSWWSLFVLHNGLVLALLVTRRWRHLIVWVVVWAVGMNVALLVGRVAQRPRPFGVACGPAGAAGRCHRCRSPSWRRSSSGSCTRWCRWGAGATPASGWRPGWWRW